MKEIRIFFDKRRTIIKPLREKKMPSEERFILFIQNNTRSYFCFPIVLSPLKRIAIFITFLTVLSSSFWGMNKETKGGYDIGDDWGGNLVASRGFSDMESLSEERGDSGQEEDIKLESKYMFRGSLEIIPETVEGLLQYSDSMERLLGSMIAVSV